MARSTAFLGFLAPFVQGPREIDRFFERAPALEERVREILIPVESAQTPELRLAAVADLASLGDAAVPALDRTCEGGNRERVRAALLALARLGTPAATASVGRFLSLRKDLELEVLGCLAAGAVGGDEAEARCLAALQSKSSDPSLRLAAAFALGGRLQAPVETLLGLWRTETLPEAAGALAVALGKKGGERAIEALTQRISGAKEPALRAGIWIGLAFAGGSAPLEAGLVDLESADPVLAAAAALALAEFPSGEPQERWDRVFRRAGPELRAAMLEGIARGGSSRSRAILFQAGQSERETSVRKALLRSVLRLHDYALASSIRKNRAGESLGGWWGITMSLLNLEGRPGPAPEGVSRAFRELRDAVESPREPCPRGALFWLATAGTREEEAFFREVERKSASLSESARIARKFLRGELDPRSYQEEVRRLAREERLLPDQGLKRMHTLYAQVLLGAGSSYFEQRSGFPNQALLARGEKRRARPAALDSTYYEDLWHWLESGPFER